MNEPTKFVALSAATVLFSAGAHRSAAKLGLPALAVTVVGALVVGLLARG